MKRSLACFNRNRDLPAHEVMSARVQSRFRRTRLAMALYGNQKYRLNEHIDNLHV